MATKKHSYHHGALRDALLEAAEKIVRRDGVDALTLRAAARGAGVSHAAPAHHFKDLSGLLTELAIVGFRRFRGYIEQAAAAPDRKPWFAARGYVSFAIDHPGVFLLMFRSENLDPRNSTLQQERLSAFSVLTQARGITAKPTVEQLGDLAAAWAMAHGFAMLYIDGRLKRVMNEAPPGMHVLDLLDVAFARTVYRQDGAAGGG
jgi:AcrR family transcriptional regulator